MLEWEDLRRACEACTACPLHETRHNVVFGVGDRQAKLMFVGEAPGEQEDLQGEPFVGAAGKLLDDLLLSVGLERQQVYIANILKCRPPGNRDPKPEEQEACIGFLRRQTALLHPKIIVCLGRIAAQRIIDPGYRITQQHGQWIERRTTLLTATFHPSFLLRDPRQRPLAYLDFEKIAAQLAQLENST